MNGVSLSVLTENSTDGAEGGHQRACVRLGNLDSSQFKITNGTRQGSVLSPYLFSACYLDELLVKLREEDIGCHVAGLWMGACCFADDLCLLAPNPQVLQKMVKICENFAKEHNIVFSTSQNVKQSKTKCIAFGGKAVSDLPPIKLDGMSLPWVDEVEHLGHTLHKSLSMSYDARRAAG